MSELKDKIDDIRSSVKDEVNDSVQTIKKDVKAYCSKGVM